MNAEPSFGLHAALAELGTDLSAALEHVPIPAYLVSDDARMVWENDRLESLVGDVVGRSVFDVVAPESRRKAEEQHALKRLAGKATHYDISNAQLFVQKTTGWWQFYLQGGAYNLPAIGVPFLSTADTIKNIYGPFPQGYAKFVKGNFNVEIGALPTLIGAEYTFSF